jgi:hypothetical protein
MFLLTLWHGSRPFPSDVLPAVCAGVSNSASSCEITSDVSLVMKLREPGLGDVASVSLVCDTFCFLVMTSKMSLEGFRLSVRSDPSLKAC